MSAATESTAPTSESRVKAADPMSPTGEFHVDCLTYDAPHQASIAALFTAALAPCGSVQPLGFAAEALEQIAADVVVLENSLFTDGHEGPLNPEISRRVMNAIASRARAASEVVSRMAALPNAAPTANTETPPPARDVESPLAEIRDLLATAIQQVVDLMPDGDVQPTASDAKETGLLVLQNLRAGQRELRLLEQAVRR